MLNFFEINSYTSDFLKIKIVWTQIDNYELIKTENNLKILINENYVKKFYELNNAINSIIIVETKKLLIDVQDYTDNLSFQVLLEILFNNFYQRYSKKTFKHQQDQTVYFLGKISNIQKQQIIFVDSVKYAQYLGDLDSYDDGTPQNFCDLVEKNFKGQQNVEIKILDEKQIKAKQLNLLSAVGGSSKNPPRLMLISYFNNQNTKACTALVGKGVTFDAGGYALKDALGIRTMRLDKCGAAYMVGVLNYLIKTRATKNVVVVLPMCENIISANAILPSQVLVAHAQKTVQVDNPDAEGRLVLADAMSYVQSIFEVKTIITLATLTAAITMALGKHLTGVFSNNLEVATQFVNASNQVGDEVWMLPIHQKDTESIRSAELADLTNAPIKKEAGASLGAAFLQEFVHNKATFLHLDIGGTGVKNNRATGVMVKGIINFINNQKEGVFYEKSETSK